VIGKPIDYVFSSEIYYIEIFKELYPNAEHKLIDPMRALLNISVTAIRRDGVFRNWEFIPDLVKPHYFVKKVVVVELKAVGNQP
jgi:HTH-type transcriptional regulator, transcriptional repressor of NAD biosynthesis genes